MKYYKFKGVILLLLAAMISACNNESNFFLEEGQPVTRSAIYSNENDSTEYETRVIYDSNLRYILNDYRWNKKSFKYYFLNNSSQIDGLAARAAVQAAFWEWSKDLNVSFYEVNSKNDADIEIGWFSNSPHEDNCSFDASALAHTVTTYNRNTHIVVKQQLHFNENYSFDTTGNTHDLMSVALHEIGHVLCIGHSNDYSAVMYPSYKGVQRTLSKDDWLAGWSMYPYQTNFRIEGNTTFGDNAVYTVTGLLPEYSIDHWSVNCEYSNTFYAMDTKTETREFIDQDLTLTNWYPNYRLQQYTLTATIRNNKYNVILSNMPVSYITYNCYPSSSYGELCCNTQTQYIIIQSSGSSSEKLDFGTNDNLDAQLVYLEDNGPLCYSSVNPNFGFWINGRKYDYSGNIKLYKTDIDQYGYIDVDVYFGTRSERFSIAVQQ